MFGVPTAGSSPTFHDHGGHGELHEQHDLGEPAWRPVRVVQAPTARVVQGHGDGRLHEVKKNVILYAILRSELPVARGTILSTTPSTIVGGQSIQ